MKRLWFIISILYSSIITAQYVKSGSQSVYPNETSNWQILRENSKIDHSHADDIKSKRTQDLYNVSKPVNESPETTHDSLISLKKNYHKGIQYIRNMEIIEIPKLKLWVSKYETTISEYLEYCRLVDRDYPEWLDSKSNYYIKNAKNKTYVDKKISDAMFDWPITGISWQDADNFAQYIGGRLPTTEEWIALAKGNQNMRYAGAESIDEVGWYYSNAYLTPRSVGLLKPNGYGLYDMCGNVWEWCADSSSSARYCMGGSVVSPSWKCQIGNWEKHGINDKRFDIGFRVVFDHKPQWVSELNP